MTSMLFRAILFSKHIFQYSITFLVVITKTIAVNPVGVKRNHAFISKDYEQSRSFVPEAVISCMGGVMGKEDVRLKTYLEDTRRYADL